jgi:hypothetical protein
MATVETVAQPTDIASLADWRSARTTGLFRYAGGVGGNAYGHHFGDIQISYNLGLINFGIVTGGAGLYGGVGGNAIGHVFSGISCINANRGTIDLGHEFAGTGGTPGTEAVDTFYGSFAVDDNAGLVSIGDLTNWGTWHVGDKTHRMQFLDVSDYGDFGIDYNSSIYINGLISGTGQIEVYDNQRDIHFAAGTDMTRSASSRTLGPSTSATRSGSESLSPNDDETAPLRPC